MRVIVDVELPGNEDRLWLLLYIQEVVSVFPYQREGAGESKVCNRIELSSGAVLGVRAFHSRAFFT
jgi:hypothetical protein